MNKKEKNISKKYNESKEGLENENIENMTNNNAYDINGFKVSLVFKETGLSLDNIVESYIEEKLFVF